MYIKSARFYTGKIKKRFFSLEERYSLYFGMTGMSMVPAEIYHDYLRLSRNLVGIPCPSIHKSRHFMA